MASVIFQVFLHHFVLAKLATSYIIIIKESCHVKFYVILDCCTNDTFVKKDFTTTAKLLGACSKV